MAIKTNKSYTKRIKVTKNGKLLRRRAGRSHFMEHKSASRKRTQAGTEAITGRAAKSIKLNLGVK